MNENQVFDIKFRKSFLRCNPKLQQEILDSLKVYKIIQNKKEVLHGMLDKIFDNLMSNSEFHKNFRNQSKDKRLMQSFFSLYSKNLD